MMNVRFAAVMTMIAAGAAFAQDGATVVRQSREAVGKLQAFSYSAKTYGTGSFKDKVPGFMATISAAKAETGDWKLHIRGKADAPDAAMVEIGFDGVDARSIREKEKTVVEKSVENLADLAVFMSTQSARHPIAWEWIANPPLPGDESKAVLEGRIDVGTAACDVVFMPGESAEAPGGLRLAIGVADHLPRRIERLRAPAKAGEKPDGGRVLQLEDLRVDAQAIAASYSLDVPSEYRVKAAESNKPKTPPPAAPKADDGLLAAGTPAPEWSLVDPKGVTHTLSGCRGKVVLMDFWATWCGPCRLAMPGVQKIHEKYKDKVAVFGMNFAERADPEAFMAKQGFTYTLLLKAEKVAEAYKVTGIPCFYLIGADGKVLWSGAGYSPTLEKMLEEKIDAALGK